MDQNNEFQELDRSWWDFRKQLELTKDITPINLIEEKRTFEQCRNNGKIYNPVFSYEESHDDSYLNEIAEFETRFKRFEDFSLTPFYLERIQNLDEHIRFFKKRDSPEFCNWLYSNYEAPDFDEIIEAEKVLSYFQGAEKAEETILSPNEVAEILQDALAARDLTDWRIELTQMVARMSVNSMLKKLKINQDSRFSEKQIKRLIIHEIDSHILRSQNGQGQPYGLFAYGFPNYLETEEGLALFNENKNGLLSENDKRRYALRIILAARCLNFSFQELFEFCFPYLHNNFDKAFSMVTRIKRGLSDTNLPGGFTKDLVYFRGFMKVSKLNNATIRDLYIGKIGIEHLPVLAELNLQRNYKTPDWLGDNSDTKNQII